MLVRLLIQVLETMYVQRSIITLQKVDRWSSDKSIGPLKKKWMIVANQPIPIGPMIPVSEFLPGEDYQY
jgi:hypothetical protein